MRLPLKTLFILTFLLHSMFLFASVSPIDTLQSDYVNQRSNLQGALFHTTTLFFQTGSDNLDTQALLLIEKLVADTKNRSNYSFIISGFTDPAGSVAFNQKLSEKRAEKVKLELLKRGITESQLVLKAFGESKSANTSFPDYNKMRKVEIKMMVFVK
jgi:outer membrane protein OmpA-like peptidoglycan-associated protein